MPKPKPDYGDMIDLPDDPGDHHMIVQPDDRSIVQERPAAKRVAGKSKAAPVEDDGRVQRSLYAKPATFEKIRRFAFENNRPSQEIYREGLLLVLRKYGLAEGMKADDV